MDFLNKKITNLACQGATPAIYRTVTSFVGGGIFRQFCIFYLSKFGSVATTSQDAKLYFRSEHCILGHKTPSGPYVIPGPVSVQQNLVKRSLCHSRSTIFGLRSQGMRHLLKCGRQECPNTWDPEDLKRGLAHTLPEKPQNICISGC